MRGDQPNTFWSGSLSFSDPQLLCPGSRDQVSSTKLWTFRDLDLDWIWTGSRLDLDWIWTRSGLDLDWIWTRASAFSSILQRSSSVLQRSSSVLQRSSSVLQRSSSVLQRSPAFHGLRSNFSAHIFPFLISSGLGFQKQENVPDTDRKTGTGSIMYQHNFSTRRKRRTSRGQSQNWTVSERSMRSGQGNPPWPPLGLGLWGQQRTQFLNDEAVCGLGRLKTGPLAIT
ncbi:uncharacterized protein V6R79_024994 [Siganus canaliculatus]